MFPYFHRLAHRQPAESKVWPRKWSDRLVDVTDDGELAVLAERHQSLS